MLGFAILLVSCGESKKKSDKETITDIAATTPPIVTQDNFPRTFTNMRLAAIVQKAGGVNTFFQNTSTKQYPRRTICSAYK